MDGIKITGVLIGLNRRHLDCLLLCCVRFNRSATAPGLVREVLACIFMQVYRSICMCIYMCLIIRDISMEIYI